MITDTFDQTIARFQKAAVHFAYSDAKAIDAALAPLMQHHDKRSIKPLLLSLDDTAREDAGMFSLIHAAESFDDVTYVDELFAALPQLLTSAPKWASIVLMRCLNSENTKEVMVRKLRESDSEVKQSVTWLCEKINERAPSFLNKTLPILLAAK